MESHGELKSQIIKLIDSMDMKHLKASIEILQLIESNQPIRIHLPNHFMSDINYCHTNISNTFLKVTTDDNDVGPEYLPEETPFEIKVDALINEYIIARNQKYIESPNYILKTNDEVLLNQGNRVVYRDYIFYIDYLGSVCRLYVSKKDMAKKINGFCIASNKLKKIVQVNNLEKELRLCKERHEEWNKQYSTSSGDD